MLRIGVIGGGNHSRGNHLPALARYIAHYPGEVELAAFCDFRREVVESVSQEYGFLHFYADVAEMLAAEKLDGCIAVTPIEVTAGVARQLIVAGIPLLMEKPPGRTQAEAQEIAELAGSGKARVMVSMNRRFDPALTAVRAWWADRPLIYLRAAMCRHQRTEPDFFVGTAIHALDAMRFMAGDISEYAVHARPVNGAWWYSVQLQFDRGTVGLLEVMPTCGSKAESYEIFGAGCRAVATSGEVDSGEGVMWEGGLVAQHHNPARDVPLFVTNGTFAETVAFLHDLRDRRIPHPTPTEVWQSVDICHRIQREVAERTA